MFGEGSYTQGVLRLFAEQPLLHLLSRTQRMTAGVPACRLGEMLTSQTSGYRIPLLIRFWDFFVFTGFQLWSEADLSRNRFL